MSQCLLISPSLPHLWDPQEVILPWSLLLEYQEASSLLLLDHSYTFHFPAFCTLSVLICLHSHLSFPYTALNLPEQYNRKRGVMLRYIGNKWLERPNNGHHHNNPNFKEMESSGKCAWRNFLPLQAVIRSVWYFEHNLAAQCVVLINNYWANETREESQGKLLLWIWGWCFLDPRPLSNDILFFSED